MQYKCYKIPNLIVTNKKNKKQKINTIVDDKCDYENVFIKHN